MLEAMRLGAPVIAARTALPAVLAPHALAFAPDDIAGLRALLLRALEAPADLAALAQAAQVGTRELTWERTVRATATIYRELLL
jgi:glycosyltransferase involved in cell wall biosynthesis